MTFARHAAPSSGFFTIAGYGIGAARLPCSLNVLLRSLAKAGSELYSASSCLNPKSPKTIARLDLISTVVSCRSGGSLANTTNSTSPPSSGGAYGVSLFSMVLMCGAHPSSRLTSVSRLNHTSLPPALPTKRLVASIPGQAHTVASGYIFSSPGRNDQCSGDTLFATMCWTPSASIPGIWFSKYLASSVMLQGEMTMLPRFPGSLTMKQLL
mmetsp:Transcript_4442/g.12084  ORF Transcript_4442/g.12084 Transcript_4442/m.12084 type:complete len:211 (-) Transcript_4442:321-953(-)